MKKITLCAIPTREEAVPSSITREFLPFSHQADLEEQSMRYTLPSSAKYQQTHRSPLPQYLRNALADACVFVVDDSQTVCKILSLLFRGAVACVHEFAKGEDVLCWFSEFTTPCHLPQIIYLDLGLPDMDGYELLRRLRTRPELNNTVIIMLTGQQDILARVQSRVRGANAYITKPFQTPAFFAETAVALGLSTDECALHPSISRQTRSSSAKGEVLWT